MHSQFVLPALLCVAGLIILADLWPMEVEWTPDQNPDYEDDLAQHEGSGGVGFADNADPQVLHQFGK